MTFTKMHVKCSVTLADRFSPEILTKLEIKGQVLHHVLLPFEISWLLEVSGGREKELFSFGIIAENLSF